MAGSFCWPSKKECNWILSPKSMFRGNVMLCPLANVKEGILQSRMRHGTVPQLNISPLVGNSIDSNSGSLHMCASNCISNLLWDQSLGWKILLNCLPGCRRFAVHPEAMALGPLAEICCNEVEKPHNARNRPSAKSASDEVRWFKIGQLRLWKSKMIKISDKTSLINYSYPLTPSNNSLVITFTVTL